MTGFLRDVAVSLSAGLLVVAITTAAAMEDVPPERAERHVLAAALGDHAELAMNLGAGQGLVPPDITPSTGASASPADMVRSQPASSPPLPSDPAYLESVALREYERAGMLTWVAWLLEQVYVESRWIPDAESPVGAVGLTQMMPPTYEIDLAPYTDPVCEGIPRTDPDCSLRAQALYDKRLLRRYDGSVELMLASYNGGLGNIDKEVAACAAAMGCDPTRFIGHVENHCQRAAWACRQTSLYVRHIAERVSS